MKKLSLTSAIEKYKRIKATKNMQLTEKEISKFIDEQVELKESEIVDIREEISETAEEMKDDFKVNLVTSVDEDAISSRSERKSTAKYYVLNALSGLKDIDNYVKEKEAEITEKENQIARLKELRTHLEDLESVIQVEEVENEEGK